MHIVFFADQHLESLGGAQVSMRLQKRFLEQAGHVVTVVAPRMHGPRAQTFAARVAAGERDAATYVDTPSVPITADREYSFTWPGARCDAFLDRSLSRRPPADVVHVQADFWGAFLGHRFAARHRLPVVHTMHNRVGVGIAATTPAPRTVMRLLTWWQKRMLPPGPARPGTDAWAYLARLADRSDAVTAPSAHFARRLEAHGVLPRAGSPNGSGVSGAGGRGSAGGRGGAADAIEAFGAADGRTPSVDVIWNGMDDAVLAAASAGVATGVDSPGPARLIWLGRMSPEKRLLPFLQALCDSGVHADVDIVGGGAQLRAAQKLIARRRPQASVTFLGRLSHADTLRRIAAADAVVQASIGFETQGMTVFEGASLGTPAIVCDPDIGSELGSGFWQVPDASTGALAGVLQAAVADIDGGTAPVPNPEVAERFRQSSRTAAMIEVYRRVAG